MVQLSFPVNFNLDILAKLKTFVVERERESERGWGREGGSLSPNGLVFVKLDNLTFARIVSTCKFCHT